MLIKFIFLIISIVTSQLQYPVCDEIFSGTVALHNGLDQIFRHICIICQKLLGILRQTIAAIAKAWIVVMTSDTRIQTYTIDDLLGVKSFALCVCIKLVEVSHTQSQIGICKQFYRLCLGKSHEQCINVLFDRTFLKQCCKLMGCLHQTFIILICSNNNTGWIQVVIKCLALP